VDLEKSTAMNILGCLDRPTQGSYRLNDMAIDQLDDDALAEVRNRSLGFVFQQFHLLPNATAMDNVMLPMIYAGIEPEERRARARSALERVGLGQRLDNRPNQLSGGPAATGGHRTGHHQSAQPALGRRTNGRP
jgi:putative ABC transport system ATP-binding protein